MKTCQLLPGARGGGFGASAARFSAIVSFPPARSAFAASPARCSSIAHRASISANCRARSFLPSTLAGSPSRAARSASATLRCRTSSSSARVSFRTSVSKRARETSIPCRRESFFKLSGRSSALGIVAFSTRTGITRIPRSSAAAISMCTKSWGSSMRRRFSLSAIETQSLPMMAMSAVHAPTRSDRTSTKSRPGGILSTSIKTFLRPSRFARRS